MIDRRILRRLPALAPVLVWTFSACASAPSAVPRAAGATVPTAEQVERLKAHSGYETEPFNVTNLLSFEGEDGRQRYYRDYAPSSLELIRSHGAEVVWGGAIDQVFVGGDRWDDMIVVRWPSRRAFVAAFESPEYAVLADVRESGLARTLMLITPVGETRGPAAVVDSAGAERAITAVMDAWLAAYEREDAGALAALFTADGLYAANTGQLLRGRAGVRDGAAGWFAAKPAMFARFDLPAGAEVDVSLEPIRFRLAGDAAYTLSRFTIRVDPPGCVLDLGYALAVWRPGDSGEWRIESLAVNQDREELPPDLCARRAPAEPR